MVRSAAASLGPARAEGESRYLESGLFSMRILSRACILLSVTVLTALVTSAAAGAQEQDGRWRLIDEDTGEITLRGYRAIETLTFTVPAGMAPTAPLRLQLATTPTQQAAADAAIVVSVNGDPVDTILLAEQPPHVISIPPGLISTGENTIGLSASIGLDTDGECVDPNHPARWAIVGVDTELRGTFVPVRELAIDDFPAAMAPLGTALEPAVVVLPSNPTPDDLSAAAAIVFAIARVDDTAGWAVAWHGDAAAPSTTAPTVLIGGTTSESSAREGSATLTRTAAGGPHLTVNASGDGSVMAVADTLIDPLAVMPLQGNTLEVEGAPLRSPTPPPSQFTLGEIGYDQRTVRGIGERSVIYRFDVPFEWEPDNGVLRGQVVADPSRMSVALNGRQISTTELNAADGQHELRSTALPADLMRPGLNFLRFTFDLTASAQCLPSDSSPSAAIPPSMAIELPHRINGGRLDLSDFPFLFFAEPDMAMLTIVLPDRPTPGDIEDGLEIVAAFGGSTSRFAPRMVTSADVDETVTSGHVIVLGEAGRQPLLGDLENALPVPLDAGGQPLHISDVAAGQTVGPGTAQLLGSPWAENRVVLAVTGPTTASYASALDAMLGARATADIAGPAVLVGDENARGELPVIVLRSEIPPLEEPSESFIARVPLALRIVFFAGVALAVAAASLLFRRQSQDEGLANEH